MIEHKLFPTLITQHHYDDYAKFKETFFDRFPYHSNEHGQSNETTAHNDLHLDPAFSPLYTHIFKCLRKHIATVGLDPEFHQINLVKSWSMITRQWHVIPHNHADAHISFTYYVNLPTDIVVDNICFSSTRPNEYYHNIYTQNALNWNEYNANNFTIVPQEGMILIFPAKTIHFTGKGDEMTYETKRDFHSRDTIRTMRICVAGDILLTYKSVVGKSYGIMPISNWKTF